MGALEALERDLRTEAQHWHPALVLRQFLAGFVPFLLGLLASYGWRGAWPELWSLAPGAALAWAERLWPSVPWPRVLAVVRDAQAGARRQAPPKSAISTPTLQAPSTPPGR